MAVLVDPPQWPAHGTRWAHLVSDASLVELHAFARAAGLPARAFDLDHYDVPAERVADLVAAGADQVAARELLARLTASGLRVRGADRDALAAARRREDLVRRWARLAPELPVGAWMPAGTDLLGRWAEPHRGYHDLGHLHEVLVHLDVLAESGERFGRPAVLAAWFHDAVYRGRPGQDEADSAELARAELDARGVAAADEVARLVRVTAAHLPDVADSDAAALCDADLAVLAASPRRYARYVAGVRREYPHVTDEDFRRGRAEVLRRLLGRGHLFTTTTGRRRWERPARDNVALELTSLETHR